MKAKLMKTYRFTTEITRILTDYKDMCYQIIFLLIILTSCKSDVQEGTIPVIDIKKNIKNFQFVKLSEITGDIDYIPLETDSSSLMQSIWQIIMTDDRIIVEDGSAYKAFDKDGNVNQPTILILANTVKLLNTSGQFQVILWMKK